MQAKTPDKYQRKVIKSKAKNIMVIAGAGSGKTYTIVQKIKKIIENGLSPEEILCISFTKDAARNLEQRLKSQDIVLKVKTFHSLGYEIIRQNQTVSLAYDKRITDIIEKNIRKTKNLQKITEAKFIRLGSSDKSFEKMENCIILNSKHKDKLKKTMIMFINLYKSGKYKIEDFKKFEKVNTINNQYDKKIRHKLFLNLMKKTICDYNRELIKHREIDYHDMINLATKMVEKNVNLQYKYIIIDEYQDTSINKTDLIKAIKKKTKANLLVVGDDWQSIYSFTGSNLNSFTNFKKTFPKSKIIKLKRTYRNSKEVVKITEKFICKNPHQIKKKIKSHKREKKSIKIYYYQNSPKQIINKIIEDINSDDILILGRNNKDILNVSKKHRNKFKTIHSSKGLETDNTIIINLEDKYDSLPNKIKESDYLKYVKPKIDYYPYAEERRLFYVALTRTRHSNYLLVNKDNLSPFIKEIKKNRQIEIIDLTDSLKK